MTTPVCPSYAGHRFPAEVISYVVWLYFRFPLSLRHVDELLATRGVTVSHGWAAKRINGRQWGVKFGQASRTGYAAGCPGLEISGTSTRSQ